MPTPKNNSVYKAFDILTAFCRAGRPLTPAEVADAAGLALPTAHRFLLTLEDVGAVSRRADNRYHLGLLVAELGRHAAHRDVLAERAREPVEALAAEIGETVSLAAFEGGRVRPVVWSEPARPFAFRMRSDQDLPLHATALGKLLVADLPVLEREELMGSLPLARHTTATITDVLALRREIRSVAQAGVARARQELEEGLDCIAIPVPGPHGGAIAALAISGPASRLGEDRLDALVDAMRRTAARIGRGLSVETRTLPDKAQPIGRFPHVKRVGNLAFVSGTSARRRDNTFSGVLSSRGDGPPRLDVGEQTRETLRNVSDILASVGAGLSDVVQIEAFLIDLAGLPAFEDACGEAFGAERMPVVQTIAARALPHPHQAVMIKAVARIPSRPAAGSA